MAGVVRLCLSVIFICVIIVTLAKGSTQKVRHGHHHHRDDFNGESTIKNLLSSRYWNNEDEDDLDDLDNPRNLLRRRIEERRGHPEDLDVFGSTDYEDAQEQAPRTKHQHRHMRTTNSGYDEPEELKNRRLLLDEYEKEFSPRYMKAYRRKRQNRHGVTYRTITDDDRRNILVSKQYEYAKQLLDFVTEQDRFEIEVKDAQTSALCNYTVESIPDTRGSRVPRDLEHVKCNHSGSTCQGATGSYCCVQTYKRIEVSYGDGSREFMKLYVGCVCSLRNVLKGLMEATLPTSD